MGHDHHHEDPTAYYVEQLATIGVSGALGGVAFMMWKQGMLNYILNVQFHLWVLLGGIALLALVVVRALALWFTVGQSTAHEHHDHGHEHHDHADCSHHDHDQHDHAHCDHAHPHVHAHDLEHVHAGAGDSLGEPAGMGDDHGHDHGWSLWRYAILLLPIVLYFLNLPNQGFSSSHTIDNLNNVELADNDTVKIEQKGGDKVLGLAFKELDQTAANREAREYYEGRLGWLEGQLMPSKDSDKVFTLIRYKITCCAADAVPLNVAIVSPESISSFAPLEWVRVTGQIQFRKRLNKDEYLPILQLASRDKIERLPAPPANPFLQ